jgi:hypothetical protein
MKAIFLCLIATFSFSLSGFAQHSTIDIAGMHQLINQSKSEHTKQVEARNNQATVTANEQANLTLLTKMKNMYRTLQNRYNALGTAINIADIGIYATPEVRQIVSYQAQILRLVQKNPALAVLGYRTEIEFVEKAQGLIGYITGLTLSIGDVNQMKASDRKLLFDYVLMQLSEIQELSGKLVNTLTYSNQNSLLRSINPFQDYIDRDKEVAESIIQNAKYLKQ